MARDILKELEKNISDMTVSHKKVADYILKNPIEAAFSTIDQLSQNVETSTTTIVRLTHLFNYSGYTDFQRDLQESIKRMMSPSNRLEENFKNNNVHSNLLRDIVDIQMENINITLNNIDESLIKKTGILLSKANQIHISGSRSSYGVSHYLFFNLNRILGNCNLISAEGGELAEKIYRIEEKDVVIVTSLSRYVKQVVTVAKIAKEKKATVIAITDGFVSPLMNYSDIVFRIETKSPDFHNSIMSSMLVAELFISVVAMKNPESARKVLLETEEILKELDVHVNK